VIDSHRWNGEPPFTRFRFEEIDYARQSRLIALMV
jgi:hypothetical protein